MLLGLWVELLALSSISDYRPMKGPLLGAFAAGCACWMLAYVQIAAVVRRVVGGVVAGLAIAVFLGVFVYGPTKTGEELAELKNRNPGMHMFVTHSSMIGVYS